MQELGHISESYRLVRGLGLLAICDDHETGGWATPSRTIYTGHEWVQRRMARNAVSNIDVAMDEASREPTAEELDALAADMVEREAIRRLELAEKLARGQERRRTQYQRSIEAQRVARERAEDMGVVFLEEPERTSETDKAITFVHPVPSWCRCGPNGKLQLVVDGWTVCHDCDPVAFEKRRLELWP